ncbi:hypothetical protein EJ05DRAFT_352068 [Pseudovirgaria hyperparasitica]|uniref:F-box domain-containing protein n=1 Tax=Pseudovirgaria hyperparasitica TaxID=470096 RepID=A0A6A6WA54_9PEZI|nr:uncharacterized protein EJ05DRAFT_352068 [Pseudovirgaria hyperparasitica]KAF2758467.1 hypothetical protein EJ05DRAFT_352068 [Pseudovirgaria hyperparasitica]
MAVLLDLPNELLIEIGNHITCPRDALYFLFTCRRLAYILIDAPVKSNIWYNNSDALAWAVSNDRPDLVSRMIKLGANPMATDRQRVLIGLSPESALIAAVTRRRIGMVELLTGDEAQSTAEKIDIKQFERGLMAAHDMVRVMALKESDQLSLLHILVGRLIKLLGPDYLTTDTGIRLLESACGERRVDMVRLLLASARAGLKELPPKTILKVFTQCDEAVTVEIYDMLLSAGVQLPHLFRVRRGLGARPKMKSLLKRFGYSMIDDTDSFLLHKA